LDGHVPAAEVDHLGALGPVNRIESCSLQRWGLAHERFNLAQKHRRAIPIEHLEAN